MAKIVVFFDTEIGVDDKKIKDIGGFFVPNSGRSFGELPQELKEDTNVR